MATTAAPSIEETAVYKHVSSLGLAPPLLRMVLMHITSETLLLPEWLSFLSHLNGALHAELPVKTLHQSAPDAEDDSSGPRDLRVGVGSEVETKQKIREEETKSSSDGTPPARLPSITDSRKISKGLDEAGGRIDAANGTTSLQQIEAALADRKLMLESKRVALGVLDSQIQTISHLLDTGHVELEQITVMAQQMSSQLSPVTNDKPVFGYAFQRTPSHSSAHHPPRVPNRARFSFRSGMAASNLASKAGLSKSEFLESPRTPAAGTTSTPSSPARTPRGARSDDGGSPPPSTPECSPNDADNHRKPFRLAYGDLPLHRGLSDSDRSAVLSRQGSARSLPDHTSRAGVSTPDTADASPSTAAGLLSSDQQVGDSDAAHPLLERMEDPFIDGDERTGQLAGLDLFQEIPERESPTSPLHSSVGGWVSVPASPQVASDLQLPIGAPSFIRAISDNTHVSRGQQLAERSVSPVSSSSADSPPNSAQHKLVATRKPFHHHSRPHSLAGGVPVMVSPAGQAVFFQDATSLGTKPQISQQANTATSSQSGSRRNHDLKEESHSHGSSRSADRFRTLRIAPHVDTDAAHDSAQSHNGMSPLSVKSSVQSIHSPAPSSAASLHSPAHSPRRHRRSSQRQSRDGKSPRSLSQHSRDGDISASSRSSAVSDIQVAAVDDQHILKTTGLLERIQHRHRHTHSHGQHHHNRSHGQTLGYSSPSPRNNRALSVQSARSPHSPSPTRYTRQNRRRRSIDNSVFTDRSRQHRRRATLPHIEIDVDRGARQTHAKHHRASTQGNELGASRESGSTPPIPLNMSLRVQDELGHTRQISAITALSNVATEDHDTSFLSVSPVSRKGDEFFEHEQRYLSPQRMRHHSASHSKSASSMTETDYHRLPSAQPSSMSILSESLAVSEDESTGAREANSFSVAAASSSEVPTGPVREESVNREDSSHSLPSSVRANVSDTYQNKSQEEVSVSLRTQGLSEVDIHEVDDPVEHVSKSKRKDSGNASPLSPLSPVDKAGERKFPGRENAWSAENSMNYSITEATRDAAVGGDMSGHSSRDHSREPSEADARNPRRPLAIQTYVSATNEVNSMSLQSAYKARKLKGGKKASDKRSGASEDDAATPMGQRRAMKQMLRELKKKKSQSGAAILHRSGHTARDFDEQFLTRHRMGTKVSQGSAKKNKSAHKKAKDEQRRPSLSGSQMPHTRDMSMESVGSAATAPGVVGDHQRSRSAAVPSSVSMQLFRPHRSISDEMVMSGTSNEDLARTQSEAFLGPARVTSSASVGSERRTQGKESSSLTRDLSDSILLQQHKHPLAARRTGSLPRSHRSTSSVELAEMEPVVDRKSTDGGVGVSAEHRKNSEETSLLEMTANDRRSVPRILESQQVDQAEAHAHGRVVASTVVSTAKDKGTGSTGSLATLHEVRPKLLVPPAANPALRQAAVRADPAAFAANGEAAMIIQRHRIMELLKKPPQARTDEDMAQMIGFFDLIGLFCNLPLAQRQEISRYAQVLQLADDEVIFKQGDEGDSYYVVISGSVSVIVRDAFNIESFGREVAVLEEDESFGELALLQGQRRTATCITRENTSLLVVDKETYARAIRSSKMVHDPNDARRASVGPAKESVDIKGKEEFQSQFFWENKDTPLTMEERIAKAAEFIEDAAHERRARAHRPGKWQEYTHHMMKGKIFDRVMILTVLVNMTLVFWEPPSAVDANNGDYESRVPWLIAIEWVCLCLFAVQLGLTVFAYGIDGFYSDRVNQWRLAIVMLIFTDLLSASIARGTIYRWSRPWRPTLLLTQSPQLRKMYRVALLVVPRLLELFLLIVGLLLFYALLGYHLFTVTGNLYDESLFVSGNPKLYPKCDGMPCGELENSAFRSFESVPMSILSLFVLLTSENYPMVMYPAYMNHSFYAAFFLSFLALGLFFFMNLAVVVIYDAYREANKMITMAERIRERESLHAAFQCLDYWDTGSITLELFTALMNQLRPSYEQYVINALFTLMDTDENGILEEMEFFEICDMLFLSISKVNRAQTDLSNGSYFDFLRRLGFRDAIQSAIHHPYTERVSLALVLVDILALFLITEAEDVFSVIDAVCAVMFAAEALAFMFALGWRKLTLVQWAHAVTAILHVVGVSFHYSGEAELYSDEARLSALRFVGTSRLFRIIDAVDVYIHAMRDSDSTNASGDKEESMSHSSPSHSHSQSLDSSQDVPAADINNAASPALSTRTGATGATGATNSSQNASNDSGGFFVAFLRMAPVFLAMAFALASVVLYSFAVVGMDLFAQEGTGSRCNTVNFVANNPQAMFCDFSAALLTLFQILTTNNWHNIMYEAMAVQENNWVAWYFILFFVVAVLIILNLVTAVILDSFLLEANLKRKAEGVQLHQLLNPGLQDDRASDDSDNDYSDSEAESLDDDREVAVRSGTHSRTESGSSMGAFSQASRWSAVAAGGPGPRSNNLEAINEAEEELLSREASMDLYEPADTSLPAFTASQSSMDSAQRTQRTSTDSVMDMPTLDRPLPNAGSSSTLGSPSISATRHRRMRSVTADAAAIDEIDADAAGAATPTGQDAIQRRNSVSSAPWGFRGDSPSAGKPPTPGSALIDDGVANAEEERNDPGEKFVEATQILVNLQSSLRRWKRTLTKAYQVSDTDGPQESQARRKEKRAAEKKRATFKRRNSKSMSTRDLHIKQLHKSLSKQSQLSGQRGVGGVFRSPTGPIGPSSASSTAAQSELPPLSSVDRTASLPMLAPSLGRSVSLPQEMEEKHGPGMSIGSESPRAGGSHTPSLNSRERRKSLRRAALRRTGDTTSSLINVPNSFRKLKTPQDGGRLSNL